MRPPQDCFLCGAGNSDEVVCIGCRSSLPPLPSSVCPSCGLPTLGGLLCGRCLRHRPSFTTTIAAIDYRFPADVLIQRFKYSHQLALGPFLAQLLVDRVCVLAKPDFVVPMPLGRARLRARGFNQSLEIAKVVCRKLELALASELCTRTREGEPQVRLPWKERAANVRGAFSCTSDLAGRRVAIIDDVMTTGSTLNELARVLCERGATVSAWVVARALRNNISASSGWDV